MTLTEAFDLYRLDCIVFRNQSPKTEENHTVALRSLLDFVGDIPVTSLTFTMVRDWKAAMDKRRLSPATCRSYIIKLRVVLAYLKHRGVPVLDAESIPIPQRGDRVPSYVSKEQVTQLIDACFRVRSKAIVSLLFSSGIRLSELINLNREDIKNNTFTVIGKGNRARLCFVDERTHALLGAYLETRKDNNPSLFLSTQSVRRMTPTNIQLIFKSARVRAGITVPVTPHTMHHSFATNLLESNTNLFHVQAMLGHRSLQTTQQYLHVVNKDLEAVYTEHHTV